MSANRLCRCAPPVPRAGRRHLVETRDFTLMRRLAILLAALLSAFAFAACGNDSRQSATTKTTTTEAEQPNQAALVFCEVNAKLDEQEEPPTAEQFQELADVAPPEIKEEADLVAERVAAEGLDAFDDPAVNEAAGKLESWQEENCAGAREN